MKATAVAHPIQGLVKYHGLKDIRLRIPFHDSISVCVGALCTITTVETTNLNGKDSLVINGVRVFGKDFLRVKCILDKIRDIAGYHGLFNVVSKNSIVNGKGMGFSASAFAALGTAACNALNVNINPIALSELVRLGAGSATRSLAGGFATFYAEKSGKSYAEQIAAPEDVDLGMVVVPLPSAVKTDEAHLEVLSSPLFKARLTHVKHMIRDMKKAIKENDIDTIGRLAEEDTLNLHASTMTGKAHMILWEPETIRIIREVQNMRADGMPAWFSMDTGPSVFVNTQKEQVGRVADRLRRLGCLKVVVSGVGGKPTLTHAHLF